MRIGDRERRATDTHLQQAHADGVLTLTVPLAAARPRHRHDSRWPQPLPQPSDPVDLAHPIR